MYVDKRRKKNSSRGTKYKFIYGSLSWRNEEMVRFHYQGFARSTARVTYHNIDNYNSYSLYSSYDNEENKIDHERHYDAQSLEKRNFVLFHRQ